MHQHGRQTSTFNSHLRIYFWFNDRVLAALHDVKLWIMLKCGVSVRVKPCNNKMSNLLSSKCIKIHKLYSQQKDKEDFTFLRKDHARTSLIYAAFQDCRSWSLIGHFMMSRFGVELPKFYSLMLSSWGLIGKKVSVLLLVKISTLTSCESLQLWLESCQCRADKHLKRGQHSQSDKSDKC